MNLRAGAIPRCGFDRGDGAYRNKNLRDLQGKPADK